MLPNDPNDFLVIIPTMCGPHVIECVRRVMQHSDGARVRVVVVENAVDPSDTKTIAVSNELAKIEPPDGITYQRIVNDGPLGFARAVNHGLVGVPRQMTVVLNDDAFVTAGWLFGLQAAVDTETVRTWGEPGNPDRPVRAYGRIGIVGPASNNAAGIQNLPVPAQMLANGIDAFAYQYRQANVGNYLAADFISGFCIGITTPALRDLVSYVSGDDGERPVLFDEVFAIGGFEDNDLLVRAELAGWRAVVAGDTYVHHLGHQSMDRHFPGQKRGLANRSAYYAKWSHVTAAPQRVIAVYRVKLETPHDVFVFRASLAKVNSCVDGIAILLTGDPTAILARVEAPEESGTLYTSDVACFRAMAEMDRPAMVNEFEKWARDAASDFAPCERMTVAACDWDAPMNERAERNAAIGIAESMGADWVWSIDADEIPEDRWTRRHIDRLVSHPDPMVRSWDFGWLNHWDSERLVRTDAPWADGERYATGMRGFRLWRVCKASPRRIMAGNTIGLHCGNSPDHDPLAKRVSGCRFRHFGYLRPVDRYRKHARYTSIDPNPDRVLTGGGYGHLIREEGMRICPFVANDGIGLHMLVWEGEEPENVARWLDAIYGVVDEVVLVWTGAWDVNDPATGPSSTMFALGRAFGVRWVHHPLNDDLASARNAGINMLDALRRDGGGVNAAGRLGWALFVDPDEVLPSPFDNVVSIRRMAEASDSWGWLWVFENHIHGHAQPSYSETVRMSRLDPGGIMRLDGRVHEGFRTATATLRERGVPMQLRYAPFMVVNMGLASSPDVVQTKLERYDRLLRLQLQDHPTDVAAWTSLALSYFNDDRIDEGETCLKIATTFAKDEYLPFRELALHHVRVAAGLMSRAVELTAPNHRTRRSLEETVSALRSISGVQPKVGRPGALPYAPVPTIPDDVLAKALGQEPVALPASSTPAANDTPTS